VTGNDEHSAWRRPPGRAADEPAPAAFGPTSWPAPGRSPTPASSPAPVPDPAWARPAPAPHRPPPVGSSSTSAGAGFLRYTGPPPTNPPPLSWRPPLVNEPPPPRELPAQDLDRLDIEERAAQTLTQGIGMVVGAIALVLLLILCARATF
jgi:hypothetical protein